MKRLSHRIAISADIMTVVTAAAPALQQRSAPSVRRTASPVARARPTTPTSALALASDLGNMMDGKVRHGRWGVMVVSLSRGDTLYSVNPDELLQPASTMKLYTAALALDRLGADHHFSTDILRDGPLGPDGTVSGNLVLRGGGDPALSNRFLRGDANVPMTLLAQLVESAGVRRVTGDIIADATAFEERRVPEGWLTRYLQEGYAARVSALSLNENVMMVAVHPELSGSAARVVLEPASAAVKVTSDVRIVSGSRGGRVVVRRAGPGTIEAKGWIGSRSVVRRYGLVIEDPAIFTAGALREALAARGIPAGGVVRAGTTPSGATKVASLPSPPLDRLVSVMNRESVNHYAELIFRNTARTHESLPEGSATAGAALLREFLIGKVGTDSNAVHAADGSGLSTLDRTTPRALVQLLGYAHKAPWASSFHASLPVAGESDLLRTRMRATPAHGNLHAKTGTTNNVISLGGYVTAQSGEVLAFAFVYNGTDRWNARETIDAMGVTLAGFVRE
jgi:D-alanyl-D-alanine carboxypeptidase/D-alanyl-D-alanine-endopeptidase (penicillin-binding protein 4)